MVELVAAPVSAWAVSDSAFVECDLDGEQLVEHTWWHAHEHVGRDAKELHANVTNRRANRDDSRARPNMALGRHSARRDRTPRARAGTFEA